MGRSHLTIYHWCMSRQSTCQFCAFNSQILVLKIQPILPKVGNSNICVKAKTVQLSCEGKGKSSLDLRHKNREMT